MRIQRVLALLLLGTLLACQFGSTVIAGPPAEPEPAPQSLEPYRPHKEKAAEPLAPEVAPTGDLIEIAVDETVWETSPAVAFCTFEQYLVVYMRSDDIYGQRLDLGGGLVGGPFQISDGDKRAVFPDIACEHTHGRFLVVWQARYSIHDTDIRAQLVHGMHQASGSQLPRDISDPLWVAADTAGEWEPAVACNSEDHTCLVVYHHDKNSGDMMGQRVLVGPSDITHDEGAFGIGEFAAKEDNPDVAWGGLDDNYLVVWQYLDSGVERIVFSEVWDKHQFNGQIDRGATYLGGGHNDQRHPVVAYGRDQREYLIAYDYDIYGDTTDIDIDGCRLDATDTDIRVHMSIAGTEESEVYPAVAYSGGPETLPGLGADQFLVTYKYWWDEPHNVALYGQPVRGGGWPEGGPRRVRLAEQTGTLDNGDVTGTLSTGRYLVVWDENADRDDEDYEALGQMLVPYAIYLPVVLR